VSETIEAKAGPKGEVPLTFDGTLLEIFGVGPAGSLRLRADGVRVKKKKKPDKDGGQVAYFLGDGMSGRVELYFAPSELDNMQKMIDALLAAGAQPM
jgi:hypothetical protein